MMTRWIAPMLAALCVFASVTATAQVAAGPRHLLVVLRSQNGVVKLIASKEVAGPPPRAQARDTTKGWSFEALNDKNEVVYKGNLPDPHIIRGAFKDQTGKTTGVNVSSTADQSFSVRVPYGCKTVLVYGAPVKALAAQSRAKSSAVMTRINL
jgi:hypothetical protein